MFGRTRPMAMYSPPARRGTFSSDETIVDWHKEYSAGSKSSASGQLVRVERDMQQVTVEGYRTLGIVSTFIAGVEAQCLGLVPDEPKHPRIAEAAGALLVIGLLLSSFGAALSLLSARWFDLLRDDEVLVLEDRWEQARQECARDFLPETPEKIQLQMPEETYSVGSGSPWRNYLVAKAVCLTLHVVFSGFATFVAGMVLYTWEAHSRYTAIANTVVAVLGTFLILCMHLNFEPKGTLQYMSFKRIRI